jgi:hypothetical protein
MKANIKQEKDDSQLSKDADGTAIDGSVANFLRSL